MSKTGSFALTPQTMCVPHAIIGAVGPEWNKGALNAPVRPAKLTPARVAFPA